MPSVNLHSSVTWFLVAGTAVAALIYALGVICGLLHMARSRRQRAPSARHDAAWPDLTVLKPLKGEEEGLADNLRSVLGQQYPAALQIVFASTESDDPGMRVARAVAREFPDVEVRFVTSDRGFGLNPKVANLAGALAGARHDLVLQSDANVRMQPGYLQSLVADMRRHDAHLVSSVVVGVGEASLGAALENLQLCAFTAPATCAALYVAGIPCVIGKSMLLRRSDLERLGGLGLVKDLLAEDFVLGERYQQAGLRVWISPTPAQNVNMHGDLRRFFARHGRWLKMRAVVSVTGFAADLLANPLPFAVAAWLTAGAGRQLAVLPLSILVLKPLLDALLVWRMRGQPWNLRYLWLSPLRDLAMAGMWLHAVFARTVEWRGARFRLRADSRLEPLDPPPIAPPPVAQDSVGLAPAVAPASLDDQRHA